MINRNKLLICIVFSIIILPIITAQQSSIGVFKQSDCIDLIQTAVNASYVKISSITSPTGSQFLTGEVTMQKTDNYYNYTFCNTSQLGTYQVSGYGDELGIDQVWSYTFDITPLGISQSTSQGIGSFSYLLLMITLMFVFGYISFKFFNTENWWIMGIFFGFLSLVFLVYNSWLGYNYHKAVTGLPTSNIPETFFWMLLFLLVVGSLTCVALLFRHWRKIFKYMKREIKRKEPSDSDLEDWDVDEWAGEDWRLRK